jgi:hypothetical protein
MMGAGTKAGLILQALKQIGKENVSDDMIAHIRKQIEPIDIKPIERQTKYAPAWMAKILRQLITDTKK